MVLLKQGPIDHRSSAALRNLGGSISYVERGEEGRRVKKKESSEECAVRSTGTYKSAGSSSIVETIIYIT